MCSPSENPEWYAATVGGMGLTGLITWAEIQLIPITSPNIDVIERRFQSLEEFHWLSKGLGDHYQYSVAWLDCLSSHGRGIFTAGDHAQVSTPFKVADSGSAFGVPMTPPMSLINRASLLAFNHTYYHRRLKQGACHYRPFFYPLDAIHHWNRLYGPKGFYQYQCVIPKSVAQDAVQTILRVIAKSGQGSFLAVLKTFSDVASPGMMSFPMEGTTLALDFPNKGADTLRLFEHLDGIVADSKGRLYAAKDARMSKEMFALGYPSLEKFTRFVDPGITTGFWRRVSA